MLEVQDPAFSKSSMCATKINTKYKIEASKSILIMLRYPRALFAHRTDEGRNTRM